MLGHSVCIGRVPALSSLPLRSAGTEWRVAASDPALGRVYVWRFTEECGLHDMRGFAHAMRWDDKRLQRESEVVLRDCFERSFREVVS